MRFIRFFAILIAVALFACSRDSNKKLEEIDALCDSNPRLAMSMLDSIDYSSLSTPDRHRYDLLDIKSRDKAYVRHTSDSLILDVIDYYQSNQETGLYPEALYYGGRVYSDIGDLPTALEYFQKAIDLTPDDSKNLRFKGSVLSQTGRLLKDLRLYHQATPYIKKAIELYKQADDTLGIFYDNMQLISTYLNEDSIESARKYVYENTKLSDSMSSEDKIWLEATKSSILMKEGKVDSALVTVRPLVNLSDSLCRNYVLSVAAKIYKIAGILDTTYLYSKELALSPRFNNKISGFNILFSCEINPIIPKDSIAYFVQSYGEFMDSYLNKYESQEVLLQNSKYNYQLHQRERDRAIIDKLKAERDRNMIIGIGVIAIFILIATIIYNKYRQIKTEVKLMMAIQLVQTLDYSLKLQLKNINHVNAGISPYQTEYKDKHEQKYLTNSRQDNLRKELLESLQSFSSDKLSNPTLNEELNQTPILIKLHKLLSEDKGIKDDDTKTWKDIESAVHKSSPEFKERLMILTLGNMSEKEYRVALLTRCGFRPKEISNLLLRGKSTATDRRRSLTRKIFGSSADNSALDNLIQRL